MRPTRGALGRRACVCVAQAAWGAVNSSIRSKPYPPLSYSVNRSDITGAELGLLLATSCSEDMAAAGAPLCRQNYSYWRTQSGLRHAAKLEVALRRSVATVACFTSLDVYGDTAAVLSQSQQQEEECPLTAQQHQRERSQSRGAAASSSSSLSSASCSSSRPSTTAARRGIPDMDWNWLQPTRSSSSSSGSGGAQPSSSSTLSSSSFQHQQLSPTAQRGRKSLVGFARATGDNSLVANIYDVAVHPAVQGYGIGRRLVKLLVQQVQARAVYDIGAVSPASALGFWERCSFEDDREGSTFMMFVGRGGAAGDEDWAPRAPHELLEESCLGYWDAAQRSESLEALLAGKLQRIRALASEQQEEEAGANKARRGPGRVRTGPRLTWLSE